MQSLLAKKGILRSLNSLSKQKKKITDTNEADDALKRWKRVNSQVFIATINEPQELSLLYDTISTLSW